MLCRSDCAGFGLSRKLRMRLSLGWKLTRLCRDFTDVEILKVGECILQDGRGRVLMPT